jgi:hypothetical protein
LKQKEKADRQGWYDVVTKQHPQPRGPALSDRNAEFVSQQQVREIRGRAKQADSMDFFNLITGPELLDKLEALLPEYRERRECLIFCV